MDKLIRTCKHLTDDELVALVVRYVKSLDEQSHRFVEKLDVAKTQIEKRDSPAILSLCGAINPKSIDSLTAVESLSEIILAVMVLNQQSEETLVHLETLRDLSKEIHNRNHITKKKEKE